MASLAGAGVVPGAEAEGVRMAQMGPNGSRDPQAKWGRAAEVAVAGEDPVVVAGGMMTGAGWTRGLADGRGRAATPAGGAVGALIPPGEGGADLTLAEVAGGGAARTLRRKGRGALNPRSGASEAVTHKAGAREAVAEDSMTGTVGIAAVNPTRMTLVDLAEAVALKKAAGAATTGAGPETVPTAGAGAGAAEELGLAQSRRTRAHGRAMTALPTTHRGGSPAAGAGAAHSSRRMMAQDGAVGVASVTEAVGGEAATLPMQVGEAGVVGGAVAAGGVTTTCTRMSQWTAVMARRDGKKARERPSPALT